MERSFLGVTGGTAPPNGAGPRPVLCVDVDAGEAGAPEDIVLGDRVLQLVGFAWLISFLATVVVR